MGTSNGSGGIEGDPMTADRKQEDPVMGEGRAMRAPGRGRSDDMGTGRDRSSADGPARKSTQEKTSERRGSAPDLRKQLREFASARPAGWSHEDWLRFLEDLQERGHNIRDREAIGVALEKERLDLALGGVRGVGPQRRKALIERYGTVWNVRNADPAEIAAAAAMPVSLAEEVKTRMS